MTLRKIPILNLVQLVTLIEQSITIYADDDVFTAKELSTFTIDRLNHLLMSCPYYMVSKNH